MIERIANIMNTSKVEDIHNYCLNKTLQFSLRHGKYTDLQSFIYIFKNKYFNHIL